MAFVSKLATALVSPIAALITGGSKPAAPAPTPVNLTPTRNIAADRARQADLLRRRRGSGANDVTGGAEAQTAGAKTLLGP